MNIGIDIDGVTLDFERQMNYYAEMYDLLFLNKEGKINNNFNYLENYNWNNEEKDYFIKNFLILGTINCNFMIGSKEVLEMLEILGYNLFFITSRGLLNEQTIDYVKNKFKYNNIDTNNIYFKTKSKVDICKELDIDIMIEDNPNTCLELSLSNIKTLYLKDKNNEINKFNDYVQEVNNWGEILREIVTDKKDLEKCKKIFIKKLNI